MSDTDDPLPASHGEPSESTQRSAGERPFAELSQPDAVPASTYVPLAEPTAQFAPAQPAPNDSAYSGAPAYPAPNPETPGAPVFYQQPPRNRRTGLKFGIIAAVVVLLGGAAGVIVALGNSKPGASAAAALTTTPTPAPALTTVAVPSSADDPLHPGSLVKYLIPAPAHTYPLQNPRGSHNVLTLKQDAAGWTNPVGHKWRLNLLEERNYRTGAVRQWQTNGLEVEVDLLGFPVVNSAILFFQVDTGNPHYLGKPPTATKATTAPNGMVYHTKAKDKYGYTRSFAAARCGDVVIEVWVNEYGTVSLTLTNGLLFKQYKKLCP
jgi:hypothetical protein